MTRRRYRGARPGALFTFEDGKPAPEPEEPRDNPLTRRCTTCGANVAERCTRGSRRGRIPIQGYHEARQLKTTQETC